MKDRRNALLWALGWWLVRRQVRRRAAVAVAGVAGGAAARRGRFRSVLGALALVGLVAAALVAWRRFAALRRVPGQAEPHEPQEPPEPLSENAAA